MLQICYTVMMTAESKKRINLSVDKDVALALSSLAKKDGKPVATKVMDLINFALEFEEDSILVRLAEERMKAATSKKYLQHDVFWSKAKKHSKK